MLVRKFGLRNPLGNGPITVILPIDNGLKICVPAKVLGQAAVWVEMTDAELVMLQEWRLEHK